MNKQTIEFVYGIVNITRECICFYNSYIFSNKEHNQQSKSKTTGGNSCT